MTHFMDKITPKYLLQKKDVIDMRMINDDRVFIFGWRVDKNNLRKITLEKAGRFTNLRA